MKPHPIVFVPGFLGSELLFAGTKIWSDSPLTASWKLLRTPSYLLPWLSLNVGGPLVFYEPFLDYLKLNKGYSPGNDLFSFNYDWRVGIETAAEHLGQFVQDVVRRAHGGQIVFIAHSFGGLVVRLALNEALVAPEKVRLVIAAGSPMLGSAQAFKSVIEMPELQWTFDRLYRLFAHVRPNLANRLVAPLLKTFMTVRSLLELMPPNQVAFLGYRGRLLTTFEWPGWPESLKALYDAIAATQKKLVGWPLGLPRKLVLAEKWPTEVGYLLNPNNPVGILAPMPSIPGDTRVVSESAREFGSNDAELVVSSKHDYLLTDQDSLKYFDSVL